MSNTATRDEHDLLGVKAIPRDAYCGVQTARALQSIENVLRETNMGATAIGTGLNAPVLDPAAMTGQGRPS